MLIWRPTPKLPDLGGSTPMPIIPSPFGANLAAMFAGPIHFGRVCAGAFVIVIGVVWANSILEFLLRASNGTLNISSHLQLQLGRNIQGAVAGTQQKFENRVGPDNADDDHERPGAHAAKMDRSRKHGREIRAKR